MGEDEAVIEGGGRLDHAFEGAPELPPKWTYPPPPHVSRCAACARSSSGSSRRRSWWTSNCPVQEANDEGGRGRLNVAKASCPGAAEYMNTRAKWNALTAARRPTCPCQSHLRRPQLRQSHSGRCGCRSGAGCSALQSDETGSIARDYTVPVKKVSRVAVHASTALDRRLCVMIIIVMYSFLRLCRTIAVLASSPAESTITRRRSHRLIPQTHLPPLSAYRQLGDYREGFRKLTSSGSAAVHWRSPEPSSADSAVLPSAQ